MSNDRLNNKAPVSIDERRARSLLKKDARYRTARELIAAAEEITAPAYAQEHSSGKVIGGTLAGVAKAEAMRKRAESLPQSQLKARMEPVIEETGKGGIISKIS